MGLETRGGVSFCASAQRAEGSPQPCRPRPQGPAPHPSWHSRRTGQDPRQVPQKLQEEMGRGSAPCRPVPHHRSPAGSFFPPRDGDARVSARRGDALAMPLGCGCSRERWQRYLAAARPGRPHEPPAPQQARVCVRGPVARPRREVCSACPAARGEVADATEPAAGQAVKASASFLRRDQMKRCGQGSCRHGPKSGRDGLTSGVCPGLAPALGNGMSGGRVRPPHLGGFLARCREVVTVALVAVALVAVALVVALLVAVALVAAVAAWSQGCPLQPAALPSTPGCVLAELLFHPVPRRMQLGRPGPSNPPWSSLEAPWAPGTCEEPWKPRCQPGAGRLVPAAVPPAYGQVSPGAGSASVYRGGPCSFTASRLCGRLRGSGFPTPALSPPATAANLFPMPGAGPARVGARGAGAPAVGNASLPALPITKQQRVKYIPISAAPIWHLPPCSFMCSCTV